MADRPTLVHVAQHAGVSLASASRALSGQGAGKKTTEKVRQAAQELGYVPDATARSLKFGRKLQIAFAVDDIGNPVYVEMLRAIEAELSQHGVRLFVSGTGNTPQETIEILQDLKRGFADGLIISPLRITTELTTAIEESPVPVVVIGAFGPSAHVDTIKTDSARGVELAVEHLKRHGSTTIGFVNGPLDTTPGRARQRGFNNVVPDSPHQTVAHTFTVSDGIAAALELLDNAQQQGTQLDAIVAANDLLAMGVIRAVVQRGLSVPEDIQVIGIDDTEFANTFNPPVTSVNLGSQERGRLAAKLLLERIEEPGKTASHHSVSPQLTVRASTIQSTPATDNA
ncbi:LacI family DNA-binding transcriptional regulator [Timonella sp. A28]|uniref:LacI family DNA-binding transcriptional regulator n=1 Tax=Timonella sp. A28 TaxID=3442640 RepID=UPI003EBF6DE7